MTGPRVSSWYVKKERETESDNERFCTKDKAREMEGAMGTREWRKKKRQRKRDMERKSAHG